MGGEMPAGTAERGSDLDETVRIAHIDAVPGMAVAILQGVQEGYSPGGYVLFFMVTALGLFAFIIIVGQHLGLVGSAWSTRRSRQASALRSRLRSVP
jgi:hypothetical protein